MQKRGRIAGLDGGRVDNLGQRSETDRTVPEKRKDKHFYALFFSVFDLRATTLQTIGTRRVGKNARNFS